MRLIPALPGSSVCLAALLLAAGASGSRAQSIPPLMYRDQATQLKISEDLAAFLRGAANPNP